MGEWRWTGSNPIERAAIGVEFSSPFTSAVIDEAAKLHPTFKKDLPRGMNQQAVMLQMGQAGSPMPVPMPLLQSPQSVGFVFDRTDEAGKQTQALNMSGNSVAYSSASYSRWNEIWPRASRLFDRIIPIVTNSGNLAGAITLEYVNNFFWSEDTESCDISKLLVEGPFVCPNVFSLPGLWHSFHGFFRDGVEPASGTHLENINLSLIDRTTVVDDVQANRRCLDVVVSHRLMFSEPTTFTPANQAGGMPAALGECATSMHERNKDILRQLLSSAIINEIAGLGVSL